MGDGYRATGLNASWRAVAHRYGGDVALLLPPSGGTAWTTRLPTGHEPQPGAIAVGRGDLAIAVLAQLTAVARRWPWLVPCLVLREDEKPIEHLLLEISELHGRLAVLRVQPGQVNYDVGGILSAIRGRPVPTSTDLARWVAERLRRAELESPLGSQFREAIERVPACQEASVSTYSRVFARYGRFTARDWRAIARLCLHGAAGSSAGLPALPLRTRRGYARRYLRLPYHALAERAGWEWVLEHALRVGRYVESVT